MILHELETVDRKAIVGKNDSYYFVMTLIMDQMFNTGFVILGERPSYLFTNKEKAVAFAKGYMKTGIVPAYTANVALDNNWKIINGKMFINGIKT